MCGLLCQLELPAFNLPEARLVALNGDLADDRGIDGRRRRLTASLPELLGQHALDHGLGIQRLLGLGQNLRCRVQAAKLAGAGLPLLGGGLRLGLRRWGGALGRLRLGLVLGLGHDALLGALLGLLRFHGSVLSVVSRRDGSSKSQLFREPVLLLVTAEQLGELLGEPMDLAVLWRSRLLSR